MTSLSAIVGRKERQVLGEERGPRRGFEHTRNVFSGSPAATEDAEDGRKMTKAATDGERHVREWRERSKSGRAGA